MKNKKNQPKREAFDLDNHWKVNFEYKHLGSHDFPLLSPNGKDLVLTIKNFYREEVVSPNKSKDWCNIVEFKEKEINGETIKPMIVNRTNFKALETAYGGELARNWIGKKVAIYVKKGVKFGSNVTNALRFRSIAIDSSKPAINQKEAHRAALHYLQVGNLDQWHEIREISKEQEKRIIELAPTLKRKDDEQP